MLGSYLTWERVSLQDGSVAGMCQNDGWAYPTVWRRIDRSVCDSKPGKLGLGTSKFGTVVNIQAGLSWNRLSEKNGLTKS